MEVSCTENDQMSEKKPEEENYEDRKLNQMNVHEPTPEIDHGNSPTFIKMESNNVITISDEEVEEIKTSLESDNLITISDEEDAIIKMDEHDVITIPDEEVDPSRVVKTFDEMNLKQKLLRGIYACGFTKPRLLQQRVIPPFIAGSNIKLQTEQGTGRKIVTAISVLQQIDTELLKYQALILVNDKQFGYLLQEAIKELSCFINECKCHIIAGSALFPRDLKFLKKEAHIVIGTPVDVYNMIINKALKTNDIRVLVLDDFSILLSKKQEKHTLKIIKLLPSKKQTLLVSTKISNNVSLHENIAKLMPNCLGITVSNIDDLVELRRDLVKQNCQSLNEKDLVSSCSHKTVENFVDMNLNEDLLKGIKAYSFNKPTRVQKEAIISLANGRDVIVQECAHSGRKSTICISVLQRIDSSINECQALIFISDMNVRDQINKKMICLSSFMKNFKCYSVVKKNNKNIKSLEGGGAQVVIGRPENIYTMICQGLLKLDHIKVCVLYDASCILSHENLRTNLFKVLRFVPPESQIMFICAEILRDIKEIAYKLMKRPIQMVGDESDFENRTEDHNVPKVQIGATKLVLDSSKQESTQSVN